MAGMYIPVLIAVAAKLYQRWIVSEEKNIDLRQQKAEAELKFLKSQLHPHFLFNTLNNLYSLSLEKSDKAPEMILKLSDLLHFILYDCNAEKILLGKEIEQVENYIELEKLRHSNNQLVQMEINGNPENVKILPLVLLTLVENGFKHGVFNKEGTMVSLKIDITKEGSSITVSNKTVEVNTGTDNGIGLANLRSRLKNTYFNNFKMNVNNDGRRFIVNVIIPFDK